MKKNNSSKNFASNQFQHHSAWMDFIDLMADLDSKLHMIGQLCESHHPSLDLPGQVVANLGQWIREYLSDKAGLQENFVLQVSAK